MKVYYLNDTKKQQAVFKESLHSFIKTLKPGEGVLLDVSLAEDQVVFVKVWENGQVLVGRADNLEEK